VSRLGILPEFRHARPQGPEIMQWTKVCHVTVMLKIAQGVLDTAGARRSATPDRALLRRPSSSAGGQADQLELRDRPRFRPLPLRRWAAILAKL